MYRLVVDRCSDKAKVMVRFHVYVLGECLYSSVVEQMALNHSI